MLLSRLSFQGGVHPVYRKEITNDRPITPIPDPAQVVILLQQNIGAPPEPIVAVGDYVKVGQKIGDTDAFVSAPVHASVSGRVIAIENRLAPIGKEVPAVIIESDGQNTPWEGLESYPALAEMTPDDLRKAIREGGFVGMGGAMFPTHVKVSAPKGKSFEVVIINAAECEPYLTCDHRIMIEWTEDVVFGVQALLKVTGAPKAYIGIEANKPDAIAALREKIGNGGMIEVKELAIKYPQGAEKQLIKALTGREVPSGGLPLDVGCLVQNVGTAASLARFLKTGMPLVERVVTVSGSAVENPGNYLVKIGTLFSHVLDHCGIIGEPKKLISGGPMMGVAQTTADVPVVKGTSGILLFDTKDVAPGDAKPCVRCGKCVDVCPVYLLPVYLMDYTLKGMLHRAEEYHILDCIECGCCSYTCPSRRPLVQAIRMGKADILARRKKRK
ncbi:MAG: electron transport complex subunit RsxC [bacterium]|jgi:electron transport complex protein RnfC